MSTVKAEARPAEAARRAEPKEPQPADPMPERVPGQVDPVPVAEQRNRTAAGRTASEQRGEPTAERRMRQTGAPPPQ